MGSQWPFKSMSNVSPIDQLTASRFIVDQIAGQPDTEDTWRSHRR